MNVIYVNIGLIVKVVPYTLWADIMEVVWGFMVGHFEKKTNFKSFQREMNLIIGSLYNSQAYN